MKTPVAIDIQIKSPVIAGYYPADVVASSGGGVNPNAITDEAGNPITDESGNAITDA